MLQPRLKKVEAIAPLKLRLSYETGEVKIFDVAPYATGPWFGELKDDAYFRTVQMLPGGTGIEWSNGRTSLRTSCTIGGRRPDEECRGGAPARIQRR